MIGGTTSVDTLNYQWFSIAVAVLQVFAVIALFTAQAERGNIFTFIGFVLLILGLIFYPMDSMGELGIMTGAGLQEHLDQVGPVTSFVVIGAVGYWAYNLGLIIFGYGTFRAGVFPQWAGILLLLAGVTIFFRDMPGVEYIFAILAVAAWGWLGWALWKNPTPTELVRE